MTSTSNIQLTISLSDPDLDDSDLQTEVEQLLPQLKAVDGVEQAELVSVSAESVPKGSKALGGFLLGMLTAEVNPANIKALFKFLGERLGGKQIEMVVKAPELSIYTRYLVEGIETGAADKDGHGWISAKDLHEYVSVKVQEATPAMTPKFYPVEEGYLIRLAKAPVDDPQLRYRKEVEVIVREDEGEISPINRTSLNELRNSLNLSPETTDAIESKVLEPLRQRWSKLQRYEQVFSEAIHQQYPLSKRKQNSLKRLQLVLDLRDEDVEPIEQRIDQQRRRRSIKRLLTRQQFIWLAGVGGVGVLVNVVYRASFQENSPQPTPLPSQSPSLGKSPQPTQLKANTGLREFEFEIVRVDKQGNITNRRPGKANLFTENLGNGVNLEMVEISGGQFLMGSPEGEEGRSDNESPQHTVTIQPFFMGKFPVTQAQWSAVAALPKVNIDLKLNPSGFKGANRPVEQVSWKEAIEFCARLSKKTGRTYRLPSEAEWEYACRAGTTTPFHFGETITTDLANYKGNYTYGAAPKGQYRGQTTDVESFPPNAFGLYDMHGNVWEWCQDTWHDNYEGAPADGSAWIKSNDNDCRALRGGLWAYVPWYCRSAYRVWLDAVSANYYYGFRVACAAARTP